MNMQYNGMNDMTEGFFFGIRKENRCFDMNPYSRKLNDHQVSTCDDRYDVDNSENKCGDHENVWSGYIQSLEIRPVGFHDSS